MKLFKSCLILIIILAVAGFGAVLYGNKYYNDAINDKSGSSEVVAVEIPSGSTSDDIAAILKEKGLIENDFIFKFYLKRTDKGAELKAGKYEFFGNQSIVEIVDELGKGAVAKGVKVTILEGYTYKQISDTIAERFAENEVEGITAAELNAIAASPDGQAFSSDVTTFLSTYKPAGKSLEGFLYPDTYEFAKDMDEVGILNTMLKHFMDKTADVVAESDASDSEFSFYEKLTLASIIERESFTNEERPIIASVFYNRLAINQALQSDATVNYFTEANNPRPTQAEIDTPSPYNTYLNPGLAPTPISNPRLESIEAAVNPADTDYYYFIHEQDGSGQVHFAETFAEHGANIRKYLD